MRYSYRYRTFFWPALLILAGIVALLVNTGRLPVERLGLLVALWPLVLVVIGLELVVRRTVHGVAGDVAAALIVLLAIAGSAAYVTFGSNPAATHTYDAVGPGGSVNEAALKINVGAATVSIAGGAESTDLYRAHIEYSGAQPTVQFDPETHVLRVDQSDRGFTIFPSSNFALQLQLSSAVRWSITSNSGAATLTMDLAQLPVTSLSLNTGASKDEITLGTPSGTVPVEINGGALTVHLHRPSGVSTKVEVSGGAVSLDADGHSFHAIGHATYEALGPGEDGYQVRVNGGACTVTLDTAVHSG